MISKGQEFHSTWPKHSCMEEVVWLDAMDVRRAQAYYNLCDWFGGCRG